MVGYIKVKVAEATDNQLDWLVEFVLLQDRIPNVEQRRSIASRNQRVKEVSFASDWGQCGRIIDMPKPGTADKKMELIAADGGIYASYAKGRLWWGPTYQIAACRCFVSAKLGLVVEVPDDLD